MSPFEIAGQIATNGANTLQTLEPEARLFRRRAIKRIGGGDPVQVEWAVAELDGVRVYFNGSDVVVTRQDLNP